MFPISGYSRHAPGMLFQARASLKVVLVVLIRISGICLGVPVFFKGLFKAGLQGSYAFFRLLLRNSIGPLRGKQLVEPLKKNSVGVRRESLLGGGA